MVPGVLVASVHSDLMLRSRGFEAGEAEVS